MEFVPLLFLVIDPFGNLPFVLSILRDLPPPAYRRAIVREVALAFAILMLFAAAGEDLFTYLDIDRSSLQISGGIILFLISLKMIFQGSTTLFTDDYVSNPILVPIAVPSIAGPAAITTVMLLHGQQRARLGDIFVALAIVLFATLVILALGRWLKSVLGHRGILALEKFMGLLLNLVSVNLFMEGIEAWLRGHAG